MFSRLAAAGLAASPPHGSLSISMRIAVPGYIPRPVRGDTVVGFNFVSAQYFETLGQSLVRGRDFDARDTPGSPRVAIVNERFVEHFFDGRDPVGRRFRQGAEEMEIVGVVADSRDHAIRSDPTDTVYMPEKQGPTADMTLLVRAADDPERIVPALRALAGSIDPRMPVISVHTLDVDVEAGMSRERILGYLSALFAGLTLLLAGIGLYGVLASAVARRTREIGLRLALGARGRDVAALFGRETATLVLARATLGGLLAFTCARVLEGVLFGVAATDPLTLAASVALLAAAAALATRLRCGARRGWTPWSLCGRSDRICVSTAMERFAAVRRGWKRVTRLTPVAATAFACGCAASGSDSTGRRSGRRRLDGTMARMTAMRRPTSPGDLRRRSVARPLGVLSVLAACMMIGAAMPAAAPAQPRPGALPPSAYLEDFDSAWTFIRDNYAYLDEKAVDWEQVRTRLRPRVTAIRDNHAFIQLLEELVEHLYDHHAHLGVNTPSSPRLVPSGTDLWAVHRNGTPFITQVRAGSEAERTGLRAGMEVVSIDGRPVGDAVDDRLPAAVDGDRPAARDWALRALLAGRQNAAVRLEVRTDSRMRRVEFEPGRSVRSEAALTARLLDHRAGYVRIHDSLGQAALVREWDAALDTLREADGLILDLRDTPGGGNSTVARALLGRLVSEVRPYQRHDLPGEERRYGVQRIWVEHVAPRGPYTYTGPIAVLVGRWTGSMGEGVAIGLDGMQRATVFGSAMAGLQGATYSRTLGHTGIPVRVPAERLYHVDGTRREAFVPRLAIAAASSGEDAGLETAIQWMQGLPTPIGR